MPRLSDKQQRQLQAEIMKGVPDKELLKKYGISDRALRDHRAKLGVSRAKQRPKEHETIFQDPAATEKIESYQESDIMPKSDEKSEAEELPPLQGEAVPEKETITPKDDGAPALDPKKDYCGECYRRGKAVELEKGAKKCPSCAVELEW